MSSEDTVDFEADPSSAPHPIIGLAVAVFFVYIYVSGDLAEQDLLVLRSMRRLGDWWPLPLTVAVVMFCGLLVVLGAQARFAGPMVRLGDDTLEVLTDTPIRDWGRVTLRRDEIRRVTLGSKRGRHHSIRIETRDATIRVGLLPRGLTRVELVREINSWLRRSH